MTAEPYPNAPQVAGVTFRHPIVPMDFHDMNTIANASRFADGMVFVTSDQDFRDYYEHLSNCDLATDVVVATRGDRIVGYGRASWRQEPNGPRIYEPNSFTAPEEEALFDPIMEAMEQRCRDIAATHPATEKWFDTLAPDRGQARVAAIRARGYEPVRYFFSMVRPNLDDLPDAPLPEGLEIRPVQPDQLRQIFDADAEAMSDGWGFTEPTEANFELFATERAPGDQLLWRVAWDGDQVAGMVRGYISGEENELYGRKRGYVENISTRRPWRRRGVARALIASTITALRERGMTEGALGVDSENPSGALHLYESCGFITESRSATYRKRLE